METADMGLGRPDASVGEIRRGEVVVGEVEIDRDRSVRCSSWLVPRTISSAKTRARQSSWSATCRARAGAGAVRCAGTVDALTQGLLGALAADPNHC
jgi:hypothetical protein